MSIDTKLLGVDLIPNSRIETKAEVETYLQRLFYALDQDASLILQVNRKSDQEKEHRFTNVFTVADLFQDEDPVNAIKRELRELTVGEYLQTVTDLRFPKKPEMREFGKTYKSNGDVYIKLRVELLANRGNHSIFVMSFHYAEIPFRDDMFPYRAPLLERRNPVLGDNLIVEESEN